MPDSTHPKTGAPAVRGEAAPSEFDLFFESTPSPMVLVTEDGYLLRANLACQTLSGFSAGELRDKPFLNFVHADDREAAELAILEMNAARGGRTVEFRMLCKDGSSKRTEWTGARLAERQAIYLTGKDASAAYAAMEKLAERARQQELVVELGRNALAAADLASLMSETVTLLARTLKAKCAEIRELRPDARQFVFKAGYGWKESPVTLAPVSVDPDTVSEYMLSTDRPVIFADLRCETRFHGSALLCEHGVISGVGCVIPGPQQPYGILAAYSDQPRAFTDDDVYFLEAVANNLAAAIDRKRREEERIRFFERTLSPLVIIGFDGSYKYVNPAVAELTGCTQDEMLSRPYDSFFHPDDVASAKMALSALHAGKPLHDVEVRFRAKDGSYRWLSSDLAPDPERQLFYVISHDVTDRHQAEETLAERARQQQAVTELGTRALAGGDPAELMNDAATVLAETLSVEFAEVFELLAGEQELLLRAGYGWQQDQLGRSRAGAGADTLCGHLLETKRPVVVEDLSREMRFRGSFQAAGQEAISGMACLIPGTDRPFGVLASHSSRARPFNENDVHFLETVANILAAAMERHRAEEELERFFEPSLNAMFVASFDGMIKRCNPALEQLTGYACEELKARPIPSFIHPDDQQAVVMELQAVATGRPARAFEARVICKDGSVKWTLWNATSFLDWQVFYASGQDVTDRHLAEESLAKQARHQKAVAEFGARALAGGELAALFDDAVTVVAETLKAEFAMFLQREPDGQDLLFKAGLGWEPELIGESKMPVDLRYVYGYALASEKPVVVENLATETRFSPDPLAVSRAMVSEMACVVPGRREPHGVLCVHSNQARHFSEDETHFLQAVASILAPAIERCQAEEQLNRFFEPSLSPMAVMGFDGKIKQCNRALDMLLGYAHQELLNMPFMELVYPDDYRMVVTEIERLMKGQASVAFEFRALCKDGSARSVIWNATPFPDSRVFYATGQDVTDRRLAEEALRASEETLRAIGESALDGVVLIDPDGNVAHWNTAAEKIFGYTSDEILGQGLHRTVVPPEDCERYQQGSSHFRQTGEGPVIGKVLELEAMHKDGHHFPVEVSVAAVSLQGRWNAVGVVRDVSERKRNEAELVAAKQAAETANRSKSEFLANMSHEIRTPMNGVIGLTSLVLDTPLSKEQRQYLEGVMLSADALLRIINDILDFSKIEAGRLELEWIEFDLRETLGNTIRSLAVRAHEKGLELLYDVRDDAPDALIGDPARLWQVLINLVGNAIKFTDQGEVSVTVSVDSLENHSVCLRFTVRDTGIGIPADKQQSLFKPFSQVDASMSRKYGGTGLGLAISAQIVEMMNGRIWLESEPGQGSQFHFTAWFGRRAAPLPKRAPPPPSGLDGMRVLIVDDNATNRLILQNMLTHWGMRPDQADGGSAGLEALQTAHKAGDPFSLILLDVMMPVMDGFAVLEHIRQMPEIDRPVIMMLSSRDQPGDSARSRELGAAAYIIKPVRPTELLTAIVKALGISFEAAAERPAAPPAAAAPGGPNLRILLAEDNPINQMLAVRILEKAGHRVATANNGEEVLAAVARESFDLVLMDVQMPVMDGFEATALIRQQEQGTGRRLPIIAMTAHAMKGDRERCLEAGMDDYVAKPVQKQELLAAIAAATRSAAESRSAT